MMPSEATSTPQVGILGLGQIGAGVADLVVARGLPLTLWVRRPAAAQAFLVEVDRRLARLLRQDRLSAQEAERRRARVRVAADLSELKDVDLAIEAIAEDLEAKRALLIGLARHCSARAIFASTTSELPIGALSTNPSVTRRIIGTHFLAPIRLSAAVELIPGPDTSAQVVEQTAAWCEQLGRRPVVLRRSVVNPVLVAYVGEALALCLAGFEPSQLDELLVEAGFGLGPLASLDLIGLDVARAVLDRVDDMAPTLDPRAKALLDTLCEEGHLGRKSGRGLFLYQPQGPVPNPRFLELRAQLSSPAPLPDPVERAWLRIMNEYLLCVSRELGPAGALDALVSEVLGLDLGPRHRLGMGDPEVLSERLRTEEGALGGRYRPSSELLAAAIAPKDG